MEETPEERAAEKLWEAACRHDQHILDEFGIAIVGIGALFFAYGTIQTTNVKLIVALIGFGTSLVLYNDMSYARAEYKAIMKALNEAKAKAPFVEAILAAQKNSGFLKKWYQQSTTLIMSYFMLLVAWGWTVIITYRLLFLVLSTIGVTLRAPAWILDSALYILIWLSALILGVLGIFLWLEKKSKK